jgi:hypothetical protein
MIAGVARVRLEPAMPRHLLAFALASTVVCAGLVAAPAAFAAADVTRLEVRIVTGADGAGAGGYAELRVRELGKAERRIPLARGDGWPAGSTRVVPVTLPEPLDADAVARVGIYYRTANPSAPDSWEIARADVYALRGTERIRLGGNSIQGVVLREGELASGERAASSLTCVTDSDCSDGKTCNGTEICRPGGRDADVRGCVRSAPISCPVNQACIEGQGCRGVGEATGGTGGVAIASGSGAAESATAVNAAPNLTPRSVPVQTCSGRDVLLTDAGGTSRLAACPTGTACVAQPNGTGVCAPAR